MKILGIIAGGAVFFFFLVIYSALAIGSKDDDEEEDMEQNIKDAAAAMVDEMEAYLELASSNDEIFRRTEEYRKDFE